MQFFCMLLWLFVAITNFPNLSAANRTVPNRSEPLNVFAAVAGKKFKPMRTYSNLVKLIKTLKCIWDSRMGSYLKPSRAISSYLELTQVCFFLPPSSGHHPLVGRLVATKPSVGGSQNIPSFQSSSVPIVPAPTRRDRRKPLGR